MIDRRREPGLNQLADEAIESADALMRQADALLGRHRKSEPALESWLPDEDEDLPLLTDVVELDGEAAQAAAHPSPPTTAKVSPTDAWRMALSASQHPPATDMPDPFDVSNWPDDPHLDFAELAAAAPIPAVTRRPAAREQRADDAPDTRTRFDEPDFSLRREPHTSGPDFELPDWPASATAAQPFESAPPARTEPAKPIAAPIPQNLAPAAAHKPQDQPPQTAHPMPKADTQANKTTPAPMANELLPPLEFSWPEPPNATPAPPPQAPAPPPIPLEALEARLIDWLASELPGLLQVELDMLSSRIERRLIERARSELLPALAAELQQNHAAGKPARSS